MKKVLDPSTVAHYWANQIQDEGRTATNNFYFTGKSIYSYGSHFLIAKHVENAKREKAVLFTTGRYSITTSTHISLVRSAANHLNIIYCSNPNGNSHSSNFEQWEKEAKGWGAQLAKAKRPELYFHKLSVIAGQVSAYCLFFGLKAPKELVALLSINNSTDYIEKVKKIEAKRVKDAKAKHANALADWLAGETAYIYLQDGFDYLRVIPFKYGDESNIVETSQGVRLSFPCAERLYNAIKNKALKVGDPVLQYKVTSVTDKLIKIGCHTFKVKYLLEFGSKLFNTVAS